MSGQILIELGAQRRVTLGRLGHPEHTRYLGHTEPDGTIVLRPVTLVSAVPGEHPAMLATPEPSAPVDTGGPELDELLHAAGLRDEHGGKVRNR